MEERDKELNVWHSSQPLQKKKKHIREIILQAPCPFTSVLSVSVFVPGGCVSAYAYPLNVFVLGTRLYVSVFEMDV